MKKILFALVIVTLASCNPSSEETMVASATPTVNASANSARQSSAVGREDVAFNPDAGQTISEELALQMVRAYREKYPDMIRGEYFSAASFRKLLDAPDVVGIRIYNGINESGNQVMVLVPIDKNNRRVKSATIEEMGQNCPVACGEEEL